MKDPRDNRIIPNDIAENLVKAEKALLKSNAKQKLKDSIMSVANEYRISQRWREHLLQLINEIPE